MSDYFNRSEFKLTPVSQLEAGQRVRAPVFDGKPNSNVLLLAAGSELTKTVLDRLIQRGITSVRVHVGDLARMSRAASVPPSKRKNQAQASGPIEGRWGKSQQSFSFQIQRSPDPRTSPVKVQRFEKAFRESFGQVSAIYSEFEKSSKVNVELARIVAEQHFDHMLDDYDLFLSQGIRPAIGEYPRLHGLQSSMVATTIGTTMGLRRQDLFDLAVGTLVHDAGLLKLPKRIYEQSGNLSRSDWLDLAKHPVYITDSLCEHKSASHGARMVTHQIHERLNGSGYPRRLRGNQIHLLARIAAVADTFVAMISPRPHRAGMSAYDAVEQLLYSTKQGLFDPVVVRALLNTISLFPVGSIVELSDGRQAKVLRTLGETYAQPVVELLDGSLDNSESSVISLIDQNDLSVVSIAEAGIIPLMLTTSLAE